MYNFRIYIDADHLGNLDEAQKEQLHFIFNCLTNATVTCYWLLAGNKISQKQVLHILQTIDSLCKKKSVILHNEIQISGKTISFFAKRLLRKIPFETYTDNRTSCEDFIKLSHENIPEGCIFSSCLGKTVYLQSRGQLVVCPHGQHIHLKSITPEEKLTSIFDTDEYKTLLLRSINKRNKCKADCSLFYLCHGGCPLEDNDTNDCDILKEVKDQKTISTNEEYLQKAIHLSALYRG